MIDLPMILAHRFVDDSWVLIGEEYSGLIWNSKKPKPSEKDLLALWPEVHLDIVLQNVRKKRNRLLVESDWTQQSDAPIDAAAWAKYRQALRDLPANITDPTAAIEWPEPPK